MYNDNLSDRRQKSFITRCFFFPADIPWHVYARLTSLSFSATSGVWLLSVRGAGGEGRLCVKSLINASLGFHWHFSGCRRRLSLLICFFPSICHCLSIIPTFNTTSSILKFFNRANICAFALHTSNLGYFLPWLFIAVFTKQIEVTDCPCARASLPLGA